MGQLRRDGVALFYEEAGEGDPPIVLVHGWCCDHAYFAPQFEHFRRAHRVVAVDLRGHGKSDKPRQDYTIEMLADDVAWLCGELGLVKPVVIGHSIPDRRPGTQDAHRGRYGVRPAARDGGRHAGSS